MQVDNSEWKILHRALEAWQQEGKLSAWDAERLKQSIELKKTSQQIAHYFFLIALSCTLMAFGAIFIDEKILERLKHYFALSNLFISLLMAALALGWFLYIRKRRPTVRTVAYEIYVVLGGLAALCSLVYLCKEIGFGASYSGFLFFNTLLLAAIAFFFYSKALWVGTLASLMGWFGAFSFAQGSNHLFLGMNYPLRFTVFGLLVIGFAFLQQRVQRLVMFQRITYIAGLILFFTGLWGISIFGNYNDLEAWMDVRQTQVLVYGFIFGISALVALYMGIRYKDDIARDLGILFLLINFYSRYFEYFWNTLHKGLFFVILAVSFWLIGRWIEKRKNPVGGHKD